MTSWVTDNRDPSNIHYDRGLIGNLGINADKLPDLVQATDVIGELTKSAADDLGLDARNSCGRGNH